MDCLEFMKDKPDNYWDLAIVDPPYGNFNNTIERTGGTWSKKYQTDNNIKNWDFAPSEEYFNELFRISKEQIIWGANHFIENLPAANSPCWIVWDKGFSSEVTFAQVELAWTSFKSTSKKFDFNSAAIANRIHPTQKPVALYKFLLDKYAKPNDRILDTHGGSMSIAIACHDYGFELDICELDKEYFDNACLRVKQHVAQTKLF